MNTCIQRLDFQILFSRLQCFHSYQIKKNNGENLMKFDLDNGYIVI